MCRWIRGIRRSGCAYMVEDAGAAVLLTQKKLLEQAGRTSAAVDDCAGGRSGERSKAAVASGIESAVAAARIWRT